jgi:hypothetical protein
MRIPRLAIRQVVLAAALCGLVGCTALPSADTAQQYLDTETAATVSVVGRPIVFAHERPEKAVHMRDYVTLAAAAVDRSGKTDYLLIAYFWTTFDPHGRSDFRRPAAPGEPSNLIVMGDDRRIELRPEAQSAHDAGIGRAVHAPPERAALPVLYRTDLATMRYIAAARHLSVISGSETGVTYEIWQDGRAAVGALVRQLNGE